MPNSKNLDKKLTKREIRCQLALLLKSSGFANSTQRTDLLRFVVESALKGHRVNAKDIADAVLGPRLYQDREGIVRTLANHVRKALADYYAGPGCNDSIRIELLSGHGYQVEFFFSPPEPNVEQLFLQGTTLMNIGEPASLHEANKLFIESMCLDNSRRDVEIARIETEILLQFHDHLSEPCNELPDLLRRCQFGVSRLTLHEWRPISLRATLKFLLSDWEGAKADFNIALNRDTRNAEVYPGYIGFLLATGGQVKAREIARKLLRENPQNPFARTLLAICHYASGESLVARKLFAELPIETLSWTDRLVVTFVCLETGEVELAAQAAASLGETWTGLQIYCQRALDRLTGTSPSRSNMNYVRFMKEVEGSSRDGRNYHKIQILLAQDQTQPQSLSDRLVYSAYRLQEPMMLWFHLLPMFRHFRERPGVIHDIAFHRPPDLHLS
ncbi:MAG: tetratricopeptide repeat protein [Acidobacteriota bacterium]|jgi:tetratricopeptide (TPR) repeat protein